MCYPPGLFDVILNYCNSQGDCLHQSEWICWSYCCLFGNCQMQACNLNAVFHYWKHPPVIHVWPHVWYANTSIPIRHFRTLPRIRSGWRSLDLLWVQRLKRSWGRSWGKTGSSHAMPCQTCLVQTFGPFRMLESPFQSFRPVIDCKLVIYLAFCTDSETCCAFLSSVFECTLAHIEQTPAQFLLNISKDSRLTVLNRSAWPMQRHKHNRFLTFVMWCCDHSCGSTVVGQLVFVHK